MKHVIEFLVKKYKFSDFITKRKALILSGISFLFFIFNVFALILDSAIAEGESIISVVKILLLVFLLLSLIMTQRGYLNFGVNTFIIYIVLNSIYFVQVEYFWLLVLYIPLMFLLVNIIQVKTFHFYAISLIVLGNFGYLVINRNTVFEGPYVEINMALFFMVLTVLFVYFFIRKVQQEVEESRQIVDQSTLDFVLKVNNRRTIDTEKVKINLKDTVSILMISVNDVMKISDKITDEELNDILKEVMSTIRSTIRLDDYIIRWGETDFLIILHYTKLSNCGVVGEKIRKAIEVKSFGSKGYRLSTTICASAKNEESGLQEAIDRATKGLIYAKAEKKKSVVFP